MEYVSSLAQAQRSVATGGIERFVGFAGRAAAMKPEVLDKLDIDETVDAYGDLLGVPARLIVPTEQATAARRQRAEAQQRQMALQAGQAMAASAEKLGRVDVGGGKNALQALASAWMPSGWSSRPTRCSRASSTPSSRTSCARSCTTRRWVSRARNRRRR
ncbi:MAG: hypothetical protein EBY18_19795 [Alphaproteobacteria bacterium]|nr:hypothetical protein [Alphaproteobacteria bacterium]